MSAKALCRSLCAVLSALSLGARQPAIVAKLPPAFAAIGEPTHLMFDELAVRAETDDMDMLTRQLAQTLRQCMACHAAFTVR